VLSVVLAIRDLDVLLEYACGPESLWAPEITASSTVSLRRFMNSPGALQKLRWAERQDKDLSGPGQTSITGGAAVRRVLSCRPDTTMRMLGTILWLLSLQYVVGTAIVVLCAAALRVRRTAARRNRVKWSRGARSLLRAVSLPLAIALAGTWLPLRPVDSGWPLGLIVSGSLATAGCYLLYGAGRLERGGRLRLARRQARLAGDTMSLGILLLVLWFFVWRGAAGPNTALIGAAALVIAAALALLAGLSGKPRPTGHAAALLYLSGLSLLVVS
jgi:hypothetical protein